MRAVTKNLQRLLTVPRSDFSGFGTTFSTQLDPITPTSTRTTWCPATTPLINKSTPSSKTRTNTSLPPSATCVTSIPSDSPVLSPATLALTPSRTSRN